MTAKILFENNAISALDGGITNITLTITVLNGSVFPAPSTGEYCKATMDDGAGNIEIVKVEDVTGNVLTVASGGRGQEGTVAFAFPDGAIIALRLTRDTMNQMVQGVDNGGNQTGADSVSIQPSRSANTEVSSGADSITIGADTMASAPNSAAIGDGAKARIAKTIVFAAASIVRKDDGETDFLKAFTSNEVIIFSDEIELDVTADDVAVVTLPSGCKFFLNECGVIITVADTVTVDPNIEFGITGDTSHYLAFKDITDTQVGERTIFNEHTADALSAGYEHGQTTLTASLQLGATATDLKGRVYWKGILVENE